MRGLITGQRLNSLRAIVAAEYKQRVDFIQPESAVASWGFRRLLTLEFNIV